MSDERIALDVLLVEDNPGDARLVEHHLNAPHVADIAADVTLRHEATLTDGLDALDGGHDILFLDLGLPESTGIQTLERVLNTDPGIPIVVLTGLDDRETAVESIQRGAQDYLLKDDLDADVLARALRYAVERHRQAQELRRQNERLDEFASVVSHDLRNPLNVVQGRLELARREDDTEHLDGAADALDRMETLIEDLLSLAREGDAIDDPEPVDLAAAAEECRRTVATSDATVRVDAEGRIRADESRLTQLLSNLVRNAVEHGSTSRRTRSDDPAEHGAEQELTITIGTESPDTFYVEDDGCGIPESERDDVLDAGYSTAADGTGFGLMIVDDVVNAHDWSLAVTESDAGGARFEISDVRFV